MDTLKFPISQLVKEPSTANLRYSHPAFTRKVLRGIIPRDYDSKEKLVEVEFIHNGERRWYDLKFFFGIVICEAKELLIILPQWLNRTDENCGC